MCFKLDWTSEHSAFRIGVRGRSSHSASVRFVWRRGPLGLPRLSFRLAGFLINSSLTHNEELTDYINLTQVNGLQMVPYSLEVLEARVGCLGGAER